MAFTSTAVATDDTSNAANERGIQEQNSIVCDPEPVFDENLEGDFSNVVDADSHFLFVETKDDAKNIENSVNDEDQSESLLIPQDEMLEEEHSEEEKSEISTQANSGVSDSSASWSNGTYTVDSDVTIYERVEVSGEVILSIEPGCTLTVGGIHVPEGATLIVQGNGNLEVNSFSVDDAAIGGNAHEATGVIELRLMGYTNVTGPDSGMRGASLSIPVGATLTMAEGIDLHNGYLIKNDGTVICDGTISGDGAFENEGVLFLTPANSALLGKFSDWSAVVFVGDEGTIYGDPILKNDLYIDNKKALNIPAGKTLLVAQDVSIRDDGALVNNGVLQNKGRIYGAGSYEGTGVLEGDGAFFLQQVTFETNGGSKIDSALVNKGSVIGSLASTPIREGYRFDGWFSDGSFTSPWNLENDPVSEPLTLYAKWESLVSDEQPDNPNQDSDPETSGSLANPAKDDDPADTDQSNASEKDNAGILPLLGENTPFVPLLLGSICLLCVVCVDNARRRKLLEQN